ncbi:F-box only protein 28 [Onthophagus taurus]|uniref:F-box only protein 28 n=1 Tax=Onthophagus taurus TaxID=166361 RepID=UPI0039BE571E
MVSTRFSSMSNGIEHIMLCHNNPTEPPVTRVTRNSVAVAHSSVQSIPSTSSDTTVGSATSRKGINILNLPPELIEKILGYLKFKNVCQLRLVSKTMDRVCGQLLNSTFQKLQTQMFHRYQSIKRKMPRRESARRNHHLACESDIIETLYMRLTLLQMSFGKHIERKHCCFFPGEVLDEVYNILHYVKSNTKLARPYKVTDELFDLSTMAMEYFKDKIEPELPEIAYFGTDFLDLSGTYSSPTNNKYLALDSSPLGPEETKDPDRSVADSLDDTDTEPLPQSNMVLRKRIRKIKQGMKRYNSQLSLLRNDLRVCKRKTSEQQKQISEQQKQLAEQQKQTVEYTTRLDEYDKKNEEISRKFSTLLQELNKCKTELQYWRSKSPATPPFCAGCGNSIPPPIEELQALMNQGVNPEGLCLDPNSEFMPIPENSSGGLKSDNDEIKTDCATVPEITEVGSVANLRNKRKADTEMSTPIAHTAKKPRRVLKERSKRGKV